MTPPVSEPEPLHLERFMLLVFLPPHMQQRLEARAHRDGTNMASIARKAIHAYLRRVA